MLFFWWTKIASKGFFLCFFLLKKRTVSYLSSENKIMLDKKSFANRDPVSGSSQSYMYFGHLTAILENYC